jgi:hypothetical protein
MTAKIPAVSDRSKRSLDVCAGQAAGVTVDTAPALVFRALAHLGEGRALGKVDVEV